jgi:hypothetical protein
VSALAETVIVDPLPGIVCSDAAAKRS